MTGEEEKAAARAKVVELERHEREGSVPPFELYREVHSIIRRCSPRYAERPDLWKSNGMPIK